MDVGRIKPDAALSEALEGDEVVQCTTFSLVSCCCLYMCYAACRAMHRFNGLIPDASLRKRRCHSVSWWDWREQLELGERAVPQTRR